MHPTDTELVTAACQGDRASFGQLYERYYRMAVGIACSRLADIHLAEDAAQEAFAVACSTLTTLQEKHRFPQWLGTICRRKASQLADNRPTTELLSQNPEPANNSDLAALRQQVRDSLEVLDDSSREMIVLHYFSGLSYEEIAIIFDLTPQAIHGRLQRARRKLATVLDVFDSTGE